MTSLQHPTPAQDLSLDPFWMPFTANRQYKAKPRLLASASGVYYTDVDGRQVLDGTSGLWCCNAGHGRREISEAVSRQIQQMDFAHVPNGPPAAVPVGRAAE